MAKIPMTSGFTIIPEGTYIFKVENVEFDEDFGKVSIHLITKNNLKIKERFSLKNSDDEYNEKALNAFSYFCKTVMNDFTMEYIDPNDLTGHFIKAEVIHKEVPSSKDPSKTYIFANLGDKQPANGFDNETISLDNVLE